MNWTNHAMSRTNPCACAMRSHELRSMVGWNVTLRRWDPAGECARNAVGWISGPSRFVFRKGGWVLGHFEKSFQHGALCRLLYFARCAELMLLLGSNPGIFAGSVASLAIRMSIVEEIVRILVFRVLS